MKILRFNIFCNFYNNLSKPTKIKVQKLLSNQKQNDIPGYIYGFMNVEDNNKYTDFKIKIGRTKRHPEIRIKEQNIDSKFREVFSVYTICNQRLEKLIHLLLTNHHDIRYVDEKREIEWFHIRNVNEDTIFHMIIQSKLIVEQKETSILFDDFIY